MMGPLFSSLLVALSLSPWIVVAQDVEYITDLGLYSLLVCACPSYPNLYRRPVSVSDDSGLCPCSNCPRSNRLLGALCSVRHIRQYPTTNIILRRSCE